MPTIINYPDLLHYVSPQGVSGGAIEQSTGPSGPA
jgi:hypothetical protein